MLIVVVGLLLLMMLVGLAFFTFANQEHSASEYYADSYKVYTDSPGADPYFDWALEQLIIGPHDDNQQSALWPGKYSLVPNMLGLFAGNPRDTPINRTFYPTVPTDRHPFNGGPGINLAVVNGAPVVDQNFDGKDDNAGPNPANNAYLLNYVNLSAAAQLAPLVGVGGNPKLLRQTIYSNFPPIDVGYTYPDLNNLFLSHIGYDPDQKKLVVIPSFFRPALMRDSNGQPLMNWYNDISKGATDTTTRVLSPHPGHVALTWDSTINWNTATISFPAGSSGTVPRFLNTAVIAGSVNPYTGKPNPRTIQYYGYPGAPFTGNMTDSNNNPLNGQMGIFSSTGPGNLNPDRNLDYPVDNDNDQIPDGIWLDLNYPAMTLVDGRKVIPLFSFLVKDADSLINVDTAGNVAGLKSLRRQPTSPLATTTGFYGYDPGSISPTPYSSISRSNLGISRSEIN
ncbi:MAG: hypothetical protein JSS02_12440, partial [Planctomycetes bacterium]|nr:hypothetical protein [Planctomycetota bacterium]